MTEEKSDKLNDETFKSFVRNTTRTDTETETIESIEQFQDWKDDFLKTFRQYLNPVGTATAREVDEELYDELEKLVKACLETKSLVKKGKINPDSSSVKGQRCINEMITLIKNAETSIEAYVPKTKALEKKCGYTKFELAAVLVRDGFRVYGLMTATRDYLANLVTEGGALSQVLKPNQLTIVMYYFRALEAFAEFMADLGMYQVMEQCVEIYKIRPRNKKKKKFDRKRKDALDDTTDEEFATAKKVQPPSQSPSPVVVEEEESESEGEGPMFENKHKDGTKVRAIIDNGWSVGFAPGEEIKDPNQKSKKTNKKSKARRKKSKSTLENENEENKDEDASAGKNNGNDDDNNKRSKNPQKSNKGKQDDDNKYNTDTTDDEDEDEGSSSDEEDDEDDEDYIYYFDPVQGVVGKISRAACLKEQLIVAVDKKTGKETYDGIVEHWDPKKSDDGSGEMIPGKMELISTMKEVLRGRAEKKTGGLAE